MEDSFMADARRTRPMANTTNEGSSVPSASNQSRVPRQRNNRFQTVRCGACINHPDRKSCSGCIFTPHFPFQDSERYNEIRGLLGVRKMRRVILTYRDPRVCRQHFHRLAEHKRVMLIGIDRMLEERRQYQQQIEHLMEVNRFFMR